MLFIPGASPLFTNILPRWGNYFTSLFVMSLRRYVVTFSFPQSGISAKTSILLFTFYFFLPGASISASHEQFIITGFFE
jgi:hypothetical protein